MPSDPRCPRPLARFAILMAGATALSAALYRLHWTSYQDSPDPWSGVERLLDLACRSLTGVAFAAILFAFRSPPARLILFPLSAAALEMLPIFLHGQGNPEDLLTQALQQGVRTVPASVCMIMLFEILWGGILAWTWARRFWPGLTLFAGAGLLLGAMAATARGPRNPAAILDLLTTLHRFILLYLAIRISMHDPPAPMDPHLPAGSRDLPMEAHLRALSIWSRVWGTLGFAWFVVVSALLVHTGWIRELKIEWLPYLGWMAVDLAFWSALAISGFFLSKQSQKARRVSATLWCLIFLAALRSTLSWTHGSGFRIIVVLWPVLCVWTAIVLWALFHARSSVVCSEAYRDLLSNARAHPARRSLFFWGGAILTLVLLADLIRTWLWLRNRM